MCDYVLRANRYRATAAELRAQMGVMVDRQAREVMESVIERWERLARILEKEAAVRALRRGREHANT